MTPMHPHNRIGSRRSTFFVFFSSGSITKSRKLSFRSLPPQDKQAKKKKNLIARTLLLADTLCCGTPSKKKTHGPAPKKKWFTFSPIDSSSCAARLRICNACAAQTKGQRTCHHYPRRKKKKEKIEATASQLLQPFAGRRNDTTLIPLSYLWNFFFSTSAYQLVNDLAHPSSSSTEKASTTTAQTDLCWRLFIRQLSIG